MNEEMSPQDYAETFSNIDVVVQCICERYIQLSDLDIPRKCSKCGRTYQIHLTVTEPEEFK